MCINTGVSCSARQVLVFPIRYVLMCARVAVLFGETEINDIHKVAFFAEAHEEVIGLDVAMNEVLGVDVLDATDL